MTFIERLKEVAKGAAKQGYKKHNSRYQGDLDKRLECRKMVLILGERKKRVLD